MEVYAIICFFLKKKPLSIISVYGATGLSVIFQTDIIYLFKLYPFSPKQLTSLSSPSFYPLHNTPVKIG